MNVVSFANCLV